VPYAVIYSALPGNNVHYRSTEDGRPVTQLAAIRVFRGEPDRTRSIGKLFLVSLVQRGVSILLSQWHHAKLDGSVALHHHAPPERSLLGCRNVGDQQFRAHAQQADSGALFRLGNGAQLKQSPLAAVEVEAGKRVFEVEALLPRQAAVAGRRASVGTGMSAASGRLDKNALGKAKGVGEACR